MFNFRCLAAHTNILPTHTADAGKVYCLYCDFGFSDLSSVYRHIAKKHLEN